MVMWELITAAVLQVAVYCWQEVTTRSHGALPWSGGSDSPSELPGIPRRTHKWWRCHRWSECCQTPSWASEPSSWSPPAGKCPDPAPPLRKTDKERKTFRGFKNWLWGSGLAEFESESALCACQTRDWTPVCLWSRLTRHASATPFKSIFALVSTSFLCIIQAWRHRGATDDARERASLPTRHCQGVKQHCFHADVSYFAFQWEKSAV